MAKVSIVTREKAAEGALPSGLAGQVVAQTYFGAEHDPIHLHLCKVTPGETLSIGPLESDMLAYVWQGEVSSGGRSLPAGSSAIVEHGAGAALAGAGSEAALVLCFAGAAPAQHGRAGGRVHLLPAENVPGAEVLEGSHGVGGRMHADGTCESCEVWLHENSFAPAPPLTPEQAQEHAKRGIHSHSEAEVIFVAEGSIRLGQKLYSAGTAIAIAADTMYAIGAGPDGMRFINFRAGTPSDIQFASGARMSETEYWKERVAQPDYLEPVTA